MLRIFEPLQLFVENFPAFYIYEITHREHRQTGILGALSSAARLPGAVLPHEQTIPAKLEALAQRGFSLQNSLAPIQLLFQDTQDLTATIEQIIARQEPSISYTRHDHQHNLYDLSWQASAILTKALDRSGPLLIADGHHRFAVWQQQPHRAPGQLPVLLVAGHATQLKSYNRLITSLNGHSLESLFAAIEQDFASIPLESDTSATGEGMAICVAQVWRKFRIPRRAELLASVVQREVIAKHLGVADAAVSKQIIFLEGHVSILEISEMTKAAAVAIVLDPPLVEDIFKLAQEQKKVPPHSTWFGAKPDSEIIPALLNRINKRQQL